MVTENGERARQGETSQNANVRKILVFSMLGAAIVLILAYGFVV